MDPPAGPRQGFPTSEERRTAALDQAVELALEALPRAAPSRPREAEPAKFLFYDHGQAVGAFEAAKDPQYWERLEARLSATLENPAHALAEEGYRQRSGEQGLLVFGKPAAEDARIDHEITLGRGKSGLAAVVRTRVELDQIGALTPPPVVGMPWVASYSNEEVASFHSPKAAAAELLREAFVLADQHKSQTLTWLAERDLQAAQEKAPDQERTYRVRYAGAKDVAQGKEHHALAEALVGTGVVEQRRVVGVSKDAAVREAQGICFEAQERGLSLGEVARAAPVRESTQFQR